MSVFLFDHLWPPARNGTYGFSLGIILKEFPCLRMRAFLAAVTATSASVGAGPGWICARSYSEQILGVSESWSPKNLAPDFYFTPCTMYVRAARSRCMRSMLAQMARAACYAHLREPTTIFHACQQNEKLFASRKLFGNIVFCVFGSLALAVYFTTQKFTLDGFLPRSKLSNRSSARPNESRKL